MSTKQEQDKDLTIEKVKQYEGFEDISDKEAEKVIHTLREFSLLTYKYFIQQNKSIESQ